MSEGDSRKLYTQTEKWLLTSIIEQFKHIIETKKTDGTTLAIKNETWEKIATSYNANNVTLRSTKQLRKCWENIKHKTRKTQSEYKHQILLTGGGPPPKDDADPLDDMVKAIVPTITYTIENPWDSTGIVEQTLPLKHGTDHSQNSTFKNPTICKAIKDHEYICEQQDDIDTDETPSEAASRTPRQRMDGKTTPLKRKYNNKENTPKKGKLDAEKELRLKKLREGIEQQRSLHELRMEVVAAEKKYWLTKAQTLLTSNTLYDN